MDMYPKIYQFYMFFIDYQSQNWKIQYGDIWQLKDPCWMMNSTGKPKVSISIYSFHFLIIL